MSQIYLNFISNKINTSLYVLLKNTLKSRALTSNLTGRIYKT